MIYGLVFVPLPLLNDEEATPSHAAPASITTDRSAQANNENIKQNANSAAVNLLLIFMFLFPPKSFKKIYCLIMIYVVW